MGDTPSPDPPDLLAAYHAAPTEREQEAAAAALAEHWGALCRPGAQPYGVWMGHQQRFMDWFQIAARHRANHIAERLPDPFARPVATPRDAAERFLWAYRHWEKEDACTGCGGQDSPEGYSTSLRGGVIRVTRHRGQPCDARFAARALWDELFAPLDETRPVQLGLFG